MAVVILTTEAVMVATEADMVDTEAVTAVDSSVAYSE